MKVFCLTLCVLLNQVNQQVSATATFEWLLLSFDNPGGKDGDGKSCDPFWAGSCDHTFRLGVDWLGGSSDAEDTPILTKLTGSFDNTNHNNFPSDAMMNGVYNPINHTFNSWPGGILLKVHVEDDDITSPDFVDNIIYRFETPPSPSRLSSIPVKVEASGKRTTLSFIWRVYCDDNFYGLNCTKLCKAHDDSLNGHYTCDSNGNKVCLAGWENNEGNCLTKQDDCIENKCKNGADCIDGVQSYSCHCKPGFTGNLCELNIDECSTTPCQNEAVCEDGINDYTCKCSPEFVGKNCSEKACSKSNPCQNGGTCYGEKNCFCPPNYVGIHCQDPLCKVVGCLNGGLCSIDGFCICKSGYLGSRCEVDLCATIGKFCQNGGVCNEGNCVCPKQFAGDACEESLLCSSLKCERGFCQVVTMKDTQTLVPQCQCPQGFTGERCELKQEVPIGDSFSYQSNQCNSYLPSFGILIVIFIILSIIFLVIIIVLSVLFCKKRKRNHKKPQLMSTSSVMSSSSEVYSTVMESTMGNVDKSQRLPIPFNIYEDLEPTNKKDLYFPDKEFSKDDVYIPEEKVNLA